MISFQTSLLIAMSAVAAFAGLAVGGAVIAAPRRPAAGAAPGLAALAVIAGAAALQVGWEHAGALPGTRLVRTTDAVLAVLSGSLLLDVVWRCIRAEPAPRVVHAPAPALAFVAVFAAPGVGEWLTMPYLLPVHMGYTLAALVVWRAGRTAAPPARARIAAGAIALVAVVHAAQIVRTFSRGAEWARDAVPLTIAVVLAAALIVFIHPKGRRLLADARAGAADADLFARFAAWLNEPAAFRDPDLRLGDAAARLGVRPEALSAAVNGGSGVSFSTFVARRRVEEAKRLLKDPGERRTSVEAIGLLAGFKSRSAFHDAFKTHVGVTPSRFREESGPGS
jgi:AraC-like DNA-binding protein